MKCDEGGIIYSVVPPIKAISSWIFSQWEILQNKTTLCLVAKYSNFTEKLTSAVADYAYFTELPIRCHMNSKDSDSWTSGKCVIMQLMHIVQLIGMCLYMTFVHWLTQTDIRRKIAKTVIMGILFTWTIKRIGFNPKLITYHVSLRPFSMTMSRRNSCLLYAIIRMFVAKSRYKCKT